jgi:hypothetical protein
MRETIIARHARTFSAHRAGYNNHYAFKVTAELTHLQGNEKPYFSITGEVYHKATRSMRMGGCCHEEILKVWPSAAPIVALHLRHFPDGEPGEANGFYNLAGACGGLGERYHVGNSKRNFPIAPPEGKTWPTTEHRLPTAAECLGFFAEHCGITIDEARRIADRVTEAYKFNTPMVTGKSGEQAARDIWREEYEAMKPRFALEAAAGLALIKEWNAKRAAREAGKVEG